MDFPPGQTLSLLALSVFAGDVQALDEMLPGIPALGEAAAPLMKLRAPVQRVLNSKMKDGESGRFLLNHPKKKRV